MLRCGTFETPAYWNWYPSPGIAARARLRKIDDRYCPDVASAVPQPDVPGRARDSRTRRIPRRAATAQPRSTRRRAPCAGAARSRRLRCVDTPAAIVPREQGYAVTGWGQGRNFGLRPGVQDAMLDLIRELNDTHGRKIS